MDFNFIADDEILENSFNDIANSTRIDAEEFGDAREENSTNLGFSSLLLADSAKCLAFLYAIPDLPQIRVMKVIEIFTCFLNGTAFSRLEKHILQILSNLRASEEETLNVKNLFHLCIEPFAKLNTEFLAFEYFKESDTYIEPQTITVGKREIYKKSEMQIVDATVEFIPVREVLKGFFGLPSVFQNTIKYMKKLDKEVKREGVIQNFIQGKFWQSLDIKIDEKELILPILFYNDDYQTNNPLASHNHKGKCGVVYLQVPYLPPDMQSRIENIFLALLTNTKRNAKIPTKNIMNPVIRELKCLKNEGISVEVNGSVSKIFFKLVLVTGDNLGLHAIHGLNENFSGIYSCRVCFTDKSNMQTVFSEDDCVLRTVESYEQDAMCKTHGVKEISIFHDNFDAEDFHITKNIYFDLMHDGLEGFCKYDISKLLFVQHYIPQFFSLDRLNERIEGFQYGKKETRTKPQKMTEKKLKNFSLGLSASETFCFLRVLPLLIGDFIPIDDPYWELMIRLRHLIELLYSPRYCENTPFYIKDVISEYLQLLQTLFPNSMKPKHHYLLHYPRSMELMGPLSKISTIRFESKHQNSKRTASVSLSQINICKTLAIKHQLQTNYRFLNNKYSYEGMKHHKIEICGHGPLVPFELSISNNNEDKFAILSDQENLNSTNWITLMGLEIEIGSVIMRQGVHGPKMFVVHHIFSNTTGFFFFVEKIKSKYIYHYDSYKVLQNKNKFLNLSVEDLEECVVTFKARLSDGENYICKKWP